MKYNKIIKKHLGETFRDLSTLGSFLFVILTAIIFSFIDYKITLIILIGLILIEGLGSLIKILIYKKRPNKENYSNLFEKIDSSSSVSIHSARAILAALSVYHLFSVYISIFIFLFVLLIGISRIYLKKHYLSDVIKGYLFGFIIWYLTNMAVR